MKQEPQLIPNADSRNFKSEWKVSNTLGLSNLNLTQKEARDISPNFYQNVPAFLRSEGPFTVYNHHKVKGEEYHENLKLTKSNAKKRVQEQLEQLRLEKEMQRKQFQDQIASEEETFKI